MGELDKILERLKQESNIQIIVTGTCQQGLVEVPCVLTLTPAADGIKYYDRWWVRSGYVEKTTVLVVKIDEPRF